MSPIVLVAGACLGGWAWSRVTPLLRNAGHDPRPLTLTGTGDRAHLNRPEIDLSTWIADVVAHLETEELDDVTLVGHSFSGAVISGVAQQMPERLRRLIYLDAYVPSDGTSAFDAMGPDQTALLTELAQAHDGWSLPWFSDEQLAAFYGEHGLTAEDRRWMRRHITTQPLATFREALRLRPVDVPRTFVGCTRTPTAPPIPADGERRTLEAGHWPMVTVPDATATLLAELAG